MTNEELQFEFDERRAIMEIDGKMCRDDATWEALQRILKKYDNIDDIESELTKNE